jgi:hypothetical protein
MGAAMSKSISDKDKQAWLERVEKIGNANTSQTAAPQPQG